MKDKAHYLFANRQEGQMIVNLAEILVSAGLVIGAAFQAQVFWEEYQYESYYDELKRVETVLWDYKSQSGRWLGDCNGDGVIDFGVSTDNSKLTSNKSACNFDVRSQDATMRVLTDLGNINMLDDHLRSVFANEGDPRMQVSFEPQKNAEGKNVLIAFKLKAKQAQWLDEKVDGTASVDQGRIRIWQSGSEQATSDWSKIDSSTLVDVAYYFDSKI